MSLPTPFKYNPTEAQREVFNEWKTHAIGYLVSSQDGIKLRRFADLLGEHVEERVPLDRMGLPTINHFLFEMSDSIEVREWINQATGRPELLLFVNEGRVPTNMWHIREMVNKQHKPKAKKDRFGQTIKMTRRNSRCVKSIELLKQAPRFSQPYAMSSAPKTQPWNSFNTNNTNFKRPYGNNQRSSGYQYPQAVRSTPRTPLTPQVNNLQSSVVRREPPKTQNVVPNVPYVQKPTPPLLPTPQPQQQAQSTIYRVSAFNTGEPLLSSSKMLAKPVARYPSSTDGSEDWDEDRWDENDDCDPVGAEVPRINGFIKPNANGTGIKKDCDIHNRPVEKIPRDIKPKEEPRPSAVEKIPRDIKPHTSAVIRQVSSTNQGSLQVTLASNKTVTTPVTSSSKLVNGTAAPMNMAKVSVTKIASIDTVDSPRTAVLPRAQQILQKTEPAQPKPNTFESKEPCKPTAIISSGGKPVQSDMSKPPPKEMEMIKIFDEVPDFSVFPHVLPKTSFLSSGKITLSLKAFMDYYKGVGRERVSN